VGTAQRTGLRLISPDDPGVVGDVFFHAAQAPSWENLATGDRVEFSVRQSRMKPDKLKAFAVELAPVTFESAA
jgi:cold shock CspA family protein